MKCLNMKIAEILFFILNFVMLYQVDANESETSPTSTLMNVQSRNLDKNCPQFSKILHDNNLTDYKINCTSLKINNEVNIENVLQEVCFIVGDMLDFICDKNLSAIADLFKRNDSDSICPFNFSHLNLNFRLNNFKLLNELKDKDHCLRVCSDLYSKRTLCILLSKLNNLLESFAQSTTPENSTLSEINVPSVRFKQTKTAFEKVSERVIVKPKLEISDNKLIVTNDTKSMKDKKNDKNLIMTSIAEVEQKSNHKTETSKSSAPIQENNDLVSENENLNEEKGFSSDNQEDISSLGDPFPDKAEISPDLSKMESSDIKIDSSLKQKEIYSAEGFFSAEDSHFFFYLIMVSSIIMVGYIAFHNKNKILAYALEGTSGRRSRRRPNPARYKKLETNLEEVISSNATNTAASSVVY